MSSSRTLDHRNELFTQADGMAAGLRRMEVQADLKKTKEARLRTDLDVARQTDDAYQKALAENAVLKMKLRAAREELSKNYESLKTAKDARDNAEQSLRWNMSELVSELSQQFSDDDPSWYAFGLNRPSDPETPAVPENVEAIAGLAGSVHIHWDTAARANRYKVYIKKDGDEDFKPVLATHDNYAVIGGLKTSSSVSVRISAANRAGESELSAPAQMIVPAHSFATSA